MAQLHLITSEYPPQQGGVSDYSHLLAAGLASAGDTVHVWCPSSDGEPPYAPGVVVHRELGNIVPTDLYRVGKMLNQFAPSRRLLVQWVPHGYGYKSMNLFFCWWLWLRAKYHRDDVEIMVHEPFLAFGEGSKKQDVAAAVHRIMTTILLRAAHRVWMSIPSWEAHLRPFAFGLNKQFIWLPIPASIPVVEDSSGIARLRSQYENGHEFIVGHLGTYDRNLTEQLMHLIPELLHDRSNLAILLMGRGSETMREKLISKQPDLDAHVYASGQLTARDLSKHISICDVMVQPYIDGVSSRRTSIMSGLSHGIPIITTAGKATEPVWTMSRAVYLAPAGNLKGIAKATKELLSDATERTRLGHAAKVLYQERFDIRHTILALRDTTAN